MVRVNNGLCINKNRALKSSKHNNDLNIILHLNINNNGNFYILIHNILYSLNGIRIYYYKLYLITFIFNYNTVHKNITFLNRY